MRVAKQRAIFRKFFFFLLNSGFLSGSCQDSPWFPLFLYFPLFLFFVFVFSLMGLDFFFFFLFTLSPFPIFLPLSPVPLISAVTSVPRFLLLQNYVFVTVLPPTNWSTFLVERKEKKRKIFSLKYYYGRDSPSECKIRRDLLQ